MFLLESEEAMRARGAEPLAEVGALGLACDAHHITRPHPEGVGSHHAMTRAIADSGLTAADVDYINAHGTGTAANDAIEAQVLGEIFAGHAPLVTSLKGMIGHCMGAASAIEAVSCVMTLGNGLVPPTIHHETTDPVCGDLSIVANEARTAKVDVLLNNSLAFGGYDAVLCMAKPGVLPPIVAAAPGALA